MNPIELSAAFSSIVESSSAFVASVDARPMGSSGIVFSADGVIATAEHTLEREEAITVRLFDGRELPARLLGQDPTTGIAALKVDATSLAVPLWATLEGLKVGHLVMSLFRPGRTVRASLGIVSALGKETWRSPAGGRIDRYLQLDIAAQPGWSGGLVVDAGGGALGMSNAGALRAASMVIPGATLKRVVDSLLAHGRVRRGYLGVGAYPVQLPPQLATEAGQTSGLLVVSVQPDGPAQQAGLLLGDTLLTLDREPIGDLGQLQGRLDEERIGSSVIARLLRAGRLIELPVVIGARP
jgi:S1-C subfamily serine protease